MSINFAELKVKKDAAVSALFSLWKAAGDASSATLELIDYLEGLGLDVEDLRAALDGTPQRRAKPEPAEPAVADASAAAAVQPPAEAPAALEPAEEEETGKRKRKRAPRDPNLPKRPLNVQLKFHNAEQKKIQEERKSKGQPELNRTELRDAVKERWEKLDSKIRDEMLREHQVALEQWHAQTAAYRDTAAAGESEAPALSQEPASQESEPASQEPAVEATPKKKHRKSESKKDDKKRRKKAADSE